MGETTQQRGGIDAQTDRSGRTRALAIVAGLSVAAVGANTAASFLAVQLQFIGGDGLTFALNLLAVQLSFLVVGVGYLWFRPAITVSVRWPTRDELAVAFAGLVAGLVAVSLSFVSSDVVVPSLELWPHFSAYSGYNASSVTMVLVGAVLSLLVIGPVEEFLFRGVIQGRLRAVFGPVAAIGLASFVFAFFHFYLILLLEVPAAVIAHMLVYYTVMGAIFGVTYERTGTLVVPALVHGAFNAVLFLSAVPFA
ncbi:CPBP family intramembrane glutamic endopeptidase [Natronolimnobius baerhuensis]|uniref:Abortive phage infection protein n=1 Tax=Natronolimnobius baerhuensis TaxID=253108 RepID=A0A202E8P3_9EURY|nr:type II CAAX endopeptidase family protein [Natronolimnobius baerhuensis]OVE84656.1 abortive phage infection protein [Natronolimnobius baerhuensis]